MAATAAAHPTAGAANPSVSVSKSVEISCTKPRSTADWAIAFSIDGVIHVNEAAAASASASLSSSSALLLPRRDIARVSSPISLVTLRLLSLCLRKKLRKKIGRRNSQYVPLFVIWLFLNTNNGAGV